MIFSGNLTKLAIRSSCMKAFPNGLFRNQKKLTHLDLSDHKINNLLRGMLKALHNLVELNLRCNGDQWNQNWKFLESIEIVAFEVLK